MVLTGENLRVRSNKIFLLPEVGYQLSCDDDTYNKSPILLDLYISHFTLNSLKNSQILYQIYFNLYHKYLIFTTTTAISCENISCLYNT